MAILKKFRTTVISILNAAYGGGAGYKKRFLLFWRKYMAKQKYDNYIHTRDGSVVEAVQFFDNIETTLKLSKFINNQSTIIDHHDRSNPTIKFYGRNDIVGVQGDFIVKHFNGKYSICKKEEFLQVYRIKTEVK